MADLPLCCYLRIDNNTSNLVWETLIKNLEKEQTKIIILKDGDNQISQKRKTWIYSGIVIVVTVAIVIFLIIKITSAS